MLGRVVTGLETGPHGVDDTRVERGKHDVEVGRIVSRSKLEAGGAQPAAARHPNRSRTTQPIQSRAERLDIAVKGGELRQAVEAEVSEGVLAHLDDLLDVETVETTSDDDHGIVGRLLVAQRTQNAS